MATFYATLTVPNTISETNVFQNINTSTDTIQVTCYGATGSTSFNILSYEGCTPSVTSSPQSNGLTITLSNFSATYRFSITAVGNCYGKSIASLRGGSGDFLQTSGAISINDLANHFGTDTSGEKSLIRYYRNYQQAIGGLGDNLVPSYKNGTLTDWTYYEYGIRNSQGSTSGSGGAGGEISLPISGTFSGYVYGYGGENWNPTTPAPTSSSTGYGIYTDDNGKIFHIYATGNGVPDVTGYKFAVYYRTYTNTQAINQNIPLYDATTSGDSISLSDFYGADSEGFG